MGGIVYKKPTPKIEIAPIDNVNVVTENVDWIRRKTGGE